MGRRVYSTDTFCLMCGTIVPKDRVKKGAVTCSPEHAKLRENALRSKRDATECRYCRRPSTLEERAAFKRFRKFETRTPHLLYPEAYEIWKAAQPDGSPTTTQDFAKYWNSRETEAESNFTLPQNTLTIAAPPDANLTVTAMPATVTATIKGETVIHSPGAIMGFEMLEAEQ